MAGRPVAARGGNGMLYGLIAFVVIAVASLGGFIWQLTENEQYRSAAERAKRNLDKFGSPPAHYESEASAQNTTVFAAMNKGVENMAFLISGKQDAVWPAISQGSNQLLREIAETSPGSAVAPGDTLLTALRNLHDSYKTLRSENTQLAADLEAARADVQALRDGLKSVRDEFEQQVAELREETDRIEQEKADQLAAKDEQLARQQADTDATSDELGNLRKDLHRVEVDSEIAIAQKQRQVDDLQAKIRDLRPGGFDPYDIATKTDGVIMRAIPGSDVVYINGGSRDGIRPGMKFEVFSPMSTERRDDFRGKASIEVSSTAESTAECRVLRVTPGRPIVENDVIVNIAYERGRKPKFVVRGEFDLNYDGEVDFDGAERIAAVIRAWGGQVVDNIDESTDFMVVGMGPQAPTLSGDIPDTAVIRDLTDTRLDRLTAHKADIERARTLYIPVITQSQFLYLTGYAGGTVSPE